MIISHKYKFIFVKNKKTAGTSLEVFLSSHCSESDIVTPFNLAESSHIPRNFDSYYDHISAHEIRAKNLSSCWDSYFKFCVERNPWDKVISHFHFRKGKHRRPNLSLDEYLLENDFPINYERYTEPGHPSQIIVDQVLRYEHLNEDLALVFSRLGVPFSGSLDVKAKSEYRMDRRPYRDVYTPEQASLVGNIFHQELVLHGYTF